MTTRQMECANVKLNILMFISFARTVMENLHPHFGIIIQSMTDRSQIFEVVHNWVEEVGLCLLHQKTNQTDISDTHYRKVSLEA